MGNMGRPIAEGMVENFGNGMELSVVNPSPRELPAGVKYYSSVDGLPEGEKFDVVFVSVKPQIAPTVLPKYKEFMADGAIVVSIMAGTQIETIQQMLGENVRVVRTMPSICADVGKSPTGVATAKGDNFSEAESELVTKLIQSFGEVVPVEENRINAITAVAGSGPAYVCHVLESAAQALTKHCGLEYEEAKKLVLDTAIKGVRPSEQQPDVTRVREVLRNLEDKDSVANLIDKTVEAGKDANLATMGMIVDGILLRVKSAYITGAKKLGFSQEDAEKLVRGTMVGTAELAAEEGAKSLPTLEKSVVSLRGTTEAGLGKLKSAVNGRNIDEVFSETVQAAFDRAEELGNGLEFSVTRTMAQLSAAKPTTVNKAEVALSTLLEATTSKLLDEVTKEVESATASQLNSISQGRGKG